MKLKLTLIFYLISISIIYAQSSKKPLDHSSYDIWNTIRNVEITNDGDWMSYQLQPGMGDPTLKLYDQSGQERASYVRSEKAQFTWDSDFLIFSKSAPLDSVKAMRRRKVEKEDLPKDTLKILNLKNLELETIANVKGYKLPQEWSGHLAYLLEPVKVPEDTTIADSLKVIPKPNNEENGFTMILRNLKTARQDTFQYVTHYRFSKFDHKLIFESKGDSTFHNGVYYYDCKKSKLTPLLRHEGNFERLIVDESGQHVAFLADLDTSEHMIRYHGLYHWKAGLDSAMLVLDTANGFIPDNWLLNEKDTLFFSENGERLFFGIAPEPVLPDTSLLEEEIVNVEVWNYQDQRLYTQQNIELKEDRKYAYRCWFDTKQNKLQQLATEDIPEIALADEGNANIALGRANEHYKKYISWEGSPLRNDFFTVDVLTGKSSKILTNIRSYQYGLSPRGRYLYWIDTQDSCWYTYDFASGSIKNVTESIPVSFTSETHDSPTPPYPYGIAGWTEDDEELLIYDRYDIWQVDPTGQSRAINLTNGRSTKKVYRYLRLDNRERWIDRNEELLLHTYHEDTREEGYAALSMKKQSAPRQLLEGPYKVNRPVKALDADALIYTAQTFERFPDLLLSDINFSTSKQISEANPQQADYLWGSGEIVRWTSLDGKELEGMLFKPEDFDPNKKYPMIVNFYEKSSDGLHRHRHPKTERSTINYSLYVSNGYVIFNPDVHYRTGYPGESCYNSVIPGVTKLIDEGFIDKDRIGVQGHSWGGYQIAYLVTKTDMFAAAEAGAPVPNMISAYGGIRWWTGLSRMFQYEHTQSRIGGTLWEYPIRFIENSPIFFVDKINTPLLIMHNDADGHVPWYQGIELFVAMRRLDKPSWMLNYPGEPHWPLKRQNQEDFNIRMMQYFDHYLKDAPQPEWMSIGVPAIEKEVNTGYELISE